MVQRAVCECTIGNIESVYVFAYDLIRYKYILALNKTLHRCSKEVPHNLINNCIAKWRLGACYIQELPLLAASS